MRGGKQSRMTRAVGIREMGGVAATDETSLRVAIYLRVSTEEQAKSGLGLEAQERRCRAMATVKGWPEPTLYRDDGISGTKDTRRRPGLAALMGALGRGEMDAVIIHSLDRLGRRTRLILELVDEMNRCGVSLVSCKESLDTTTPTGQFVLTLFAALAQLERDTIAQRTRDALDAHGLRDGEKGGRLPYGYIRVDTGVRVDRSAAYVVRTIFRLRQQGRSLRQIADALDRDGHVTEHGKSWHHSSVAEVLRHEDAYRGGLRGASALRWPAVLHSDPHTDPLAALPDGTPAD